MFWEYRSLWCDELEIGWPNLKRLQSFIESVVFFSLRLFRPCQFCKNTFASIHFTAPRTDTDTHTHTPEHLVCSLWQFMDSIQLIVRTCRTYVFCYVYNLRSSEWTNQKLKKKNNFFWLFYVVCCAYHCITCVRDIRIYIYINFFCCVFIAKLL